MKLGGLVLAVAAVIAVAAYFGTRGDGGEGRTAQPPPPAATLPATTEDLGPKVEYAQVQAVFEKYGCIACHPGVNPSLDLTAGKSYDQLVGIQAVEDPTLYRVVAGDPGRSFLYLKVGGDAPVADIPAIGVRMPPRAPPIDDADMELIRNWILQGAVGPDGTTGGPEVPTPGTRRRISTSRPRPQPKAVARSRAWSSTSASSRSRAPSSPCSSRAPTRRAARSTTASR